MPAPALRRPIVRTSACYAAAFAPPLLSPETPAPAFLSGRNEAVAAGRYDIHRNNVTVSLINALAGIYPAVERITGSDFFRAMARSPCSRDTARIAFAVRLWPRLSELRRPLRIRADDAVACRCCTHRARLARRLSWRGGHAVAGGSARRRTACKAPRPRLRPHPTMRLIRSRYPAVTIFSMNRGNEPVVPIDRIEPEDAVITRPDADVLVSHLPPGGHEFLPAPDPSAFRSARRPPWPWRKPLRSISRRRLPE